MAVASTRGERAGMARGGAATGDGGIAWPCPFWMPRSGHRGGVGILWVLLWGLLAPALTSGAVAAAVPSVVEFAADEVRVQVSLVPLFRLGDALENGVSLTLRRDRVVLAGAHSRSTPGSSRSSHWPQWWPRWRAERVLSEAQDKLRLGYSSLSRAYVLERPDREPEYFSELVFALLAAERWLARIDPTWLQSAGAGERTLHVRIWLDRSALPLPLRWGRTIRGLGQLGGESGDAWQTHRLY